MKRSLQALVALLLLWLVLRNVDVSMFVDALSELRASSMVAATLLFFVGCGVAAARWRLLWRKATWWQMLNANFAAQFYSMLLPGQLAGEVAKTLRVGHQYSDTVNVAASVLIDRAMGVIGMLILALAGALLSRSSMASHVAWVLAATVIGISAMLYAITVPWIFEAFSSIVGRVGGRNRFLQTAGQKIVEFLSAWVSMISRPGVVFSAVCLGMVFQAIGVGVNFIVASDLGIDIGFADWCWIFGVVSVALLLPITIAGIGLREGTYAGLLGLYGVPIDKAVALSIVIFGISLLGVVAGALVEMSYARQPRRDPPR